jgi:hypothetical protein
VGKGTGQEVMNTGQNEDVLDEYLTISGISALKTHEMLGDTNRHSNLYGNSPTTGLHTTLSINQLGTNDKDMELDSSRHGNIYGKIIWISIR